MSNYKKLTLIERFVRECGKYGDTAQIPDEVIEKYIKMENDKIEQAELDAKEIIIIKQCAERATSNASSYANGYSEGYKRALEYMIDSIKNKISTKQNEQ